MYSNKEVRWSFVELTKGSNVPRPVGAKWKCRWNWDEEEERASKRKWRVWSKEEIEVMQQLMDKKWEEENGEEVCDRQDGHNSGPI